MLVAGIEPKLRYANGHARSTRFLTIRLFEHSTRRSISRLLLFTKQITQIVSPCRHGSLLTEEHGWLKTIRKCHQHWYLASRGILSNPCSSGFCHVYGSLGWGWPCSYTPRSQFEFVAVPALPVSLSTFECGYVCEPVRNGM